MIGDQASNNALGAFADRLHQLSLKVADLRQEQALNAESQRREIHRLRSDMQAQVIEAMFGNKSLDVRATPLVPLPSEKDQHAALLRNAVLQGALEGQFARHLIIPVHLPKLTYLTGLFSSIQGPRDTERARCTFIVTSEAEREQVQAYIRWTSPVLPSNYEVVSAVEIAAALGMPGLARAMIENRGGGIINMKKLLALYRAHSEGGEEMCCIDSDSAILQPLNSLFDHSAANYHRRIFPAVRSNAELTNEITRVCSDYFSKRDASRLALKYAGGLYSWFFDIPYYDRRDLGPFFDHISFLHGGIESALSSLSWHSFEHILYINYLLLRSDFCLTDISEIVTPGRLTDELLLGDLQAVEEKFGLSTGWASLNTLMSNQRQELQPTLYAISHVDRLP